MQTDRLITVAIHTYDHAVRLRELLENEGINVSFQNVNLQTPVVSSGVRVRIHECDLPLALRIIENPHIFQSSDTDRQEDSHYILVPVDFMPYSMQAAETAVRIAATHKADVCLLHSFIDQDQESAMQLSASLNYSVGADENRRKQIEKESEDTLERFASELIDKMRKGELPPAKICRKVLEGVPEDSIIEYAGVNPPLLVVMGTRGCAAKEQQLIGSVTAEVLDQCQNNVLAIPDGLASTYKGKVEKVVFFTNLDQEDLLAVDSLCRIFPEKSVNIILVHIPVRKRIIFNRPAEKDLDSMLEYCKEHYPNCIFEKDTVDVHKVNSDQQLHDVIARRYQPDLIVMPNKRANAFTRLFSPSLAHRVLFCTETPLLAIPI